MDYRTRLILLGALGIAAAPMACLYPDYTFNEPEPGTTGGGAGQGGQGGSGGQGGGMPGVEDCDNGTDDDGDSLADCADDDCTTGYACVPSPPLNWSGYVALFDGQEADQPACPSTFPSSFPGYRNLLTPPHSCSACSCGSPAGQTCDLADVITVSDKNCGFAPQTPNSINPPANWQGECYGPAGLQGGQSCAGGPCNSSVTTAKPTVTGGSCPPSGGVEDKQPAQWEAFGLACSGAPQGGGCGAGNVCQPKSATPFRSGLCVYRMGEQSCPVGEFSQQFIYYESATDNRACSPCECEAPAGSTCDATIKIYSDAAVNTCTTEIASFMAGGCANLMGNPTVFGRAATVTAPTGGSCAVKAGGGQATGALTPTNATTFCCIP
ncbi:MAG: hypothetical protein IPM54_07145 [Polyangiaceae bacterium]|nr:hypothetical protein [Polyangiaceae bacterium]